MHSLKHLFFISFKTAFIVTFSGLAFLMSEASAATIAGVTIYDFSSESGTRHAVNLVNGSGFSAITGTHSKSPDGSMWMSNAVSDTLPVHITFDLGAVYDVNSFLVWNYNENYNANGVPNGSHPGTHTRSGAKSVNISVANTLGGAFTSLGNFTFNEASGSDASNFSQLFDLSSYAAADTARLVRFDILSNWSESDGIPTPWTGLSEVRFDGAASIPEPSRAMLYILGGMGLILRRRRSWEPVRTAAFP